MKRERRKQTNDRRSASRPFSAKPIQGENSSDRIHEALAKYLVDIKQLHNESAKTHRFAMLLAELYQDPHLTGSYSGSIEKRILRIDTSKGLKNGRADSYHGNVVIEFENSLEATGAHAKEQLKEYVSGIWNSEKPPQRPLLAIATDGIVWQAYRPSVDGKDRRRISASDIQLGLLKELSLSTSTFNDYWIWLTSLLYRHQQTIPTADQFRIDFGAESPAFHDSYAALEQAWSAIKKSSEPQLAFDTWKQYLTVTYGRLNALSETTDAKTRDSELEALFLKHSYLACIARFLVWASLANPLCQYQ